MGVRVTHVDLGMVDGRLSPPSGSLVDLEEEEVHFGPIAKHFYLCSLLSATFRRRVYSLNQGCPIKFHYSLNLGCPTYGPGAACGPP
ncbi:hypothetical protein TNIN_359351 [Trichonephila inaurata madagascariensis]|uniref:Uncharacterized protein n=1 Tax=Trichonephila inaurata madagascariensis TaxID=2747483 RepID=A0A8X6XRY2_9ARAC|nr:hypothetical protein TNIN_359351 [Trichonephila inaurata madagascariensis]